MPLAVKIKTITPSLLCKNVFVDSKRKNYLSGEFTTVSLAELKDIMGSGEGDA